MKITEQDIYNLFYDFECEVVLHDQMYAALCNMKYDGFEAVTLFNKMLYEGKFKRTKQGDYCLP
jgi:hypothetical protein